MARCKGILAGKREPYLPLLLLADESLASPPG
jgi:hypothetical protein